MADETANKGGCRRFALAGIGLIAVALIGVELFYKAPVPVITGAPIPYDHLSNEALEPYPVRAERGPNKDEFPEATQKWPDARSCLIAGERDKPAPDLRLLDWRAMRNDRDFKVCLWRIFASYRTPERAKAWFEAQNYLSNISIMDSENKKLISVSGNNFKSNQMFFYPNTGIIGAFIKNINPTISFSAIYNYSRIIKINDNPIGE